MSVSLETLVPQEEPVVEETEEPPAPQEEPVPPAPQEEEPPEAPAPQVIAPAPKKRRRPRKDPAAPKKAAVKIKAPPPPVTPESSDGETPIDRDDMENLLLDYLIKRKRTQQEARRTMWATLAGLS